MNLNNVTLWFFSADFVCKYFSKTKNKKRRTKQHTHLFFSLSFIWLMCWVKMMRVWLCALSRFFWNTVLSLRKFYVSSVKLFIRIESFPGLEYLHSIHIKFCRLLTEQPTIKSLLCLRCHLVMANSNAIQFQKMYRNLVLQVDWAQCIHNSNNNNRKNIL